MAETEFVNPLDDANFASGGGLWDGKIVTIIESKTEIDRLTYGDGSPVLDQNTGAQAVRNVWSIVGVAEDDERERRETYSMGALIPTADGEGFTKPDGSAAVLHKNSEAAKLAAGMKAGGFDIGSLFDAKTGKTFVSRVVGAQFEFVGEARKDKDGNDKVSKKGFTQMRFFPVKFLGMKAGVGAPTTATTSDEDLEFAQTTVTEILAAGGGSMSRADVVREVTKKMNGDTRGPAIVGLILKPEFNASAPWTLDGTTLSLGA